MIIGSVITVCYNVGTAIFSDTLGRSFVRCDGRTLTQSTYPTLFSLIGTRYNDGTQSASQFRIPDLRGSFLRGADPTAGTDTDAPSRTINGPGNTSSDAGSQQNRCVFTHTHGTRTDDHLHAMSSRSGEQPNGGVCSSAVHVNFTDPRYPTAPLVQSSSVSISSGSFTLSPEPTSTLSPAHFVCDYIIRLA